MNGSTQDAVHAAVKALHEDTPAACARCIVCTIRTMDATLRQAITDERAAHERTQHWLDVFQGVAANGDVRVLLLRGSIGRAIAVARAMGNVHGRTIVSMLERALTADAEQAQRQDRTADAPPPKPRPL